MVLCDRSGYMPEAVRVSVGALVADLIGRERMVVIPAGDPPVLCYGVVRLFSRSRKTTFVYLMILVSPGPSGLVGELHLRNDRLIDR